MFTRRPGTAWLLLLPIVVALLDGNPGHAGERVKGPKKRDFLTFVSKHDFVKLDLPKAWDVSETMQDDRYVITARPAPDGFGARALTIERVVGAKFPFEGDTPQDAALAYAQDFAMQNSQLSMPVVILAPRATSHGVRTHDFSIVTNPTTPECVSHYLVVAIKDHAWATAMWDLPCEESTPFAISEFETMRDSLRIDRDLGKDLIK